MAELKTKPIKKDVNIFIESVKDSQIRGDCLILKAIMEKITRSKGVMWGESIVGFGSYHYKYASGREGDWFLTGFSPRKQNLTIYIMTGFLRYNELMSKLGKYKTGKSCLYIKRLKDIDIDILKILITESVNFLKENSFER
jgi:hypothetical protein